MGIPISRGHNPVSRYSDTRNQGVSHHVRCRALSRPFLSPFFSGTRKGCLARCVGRRIRLSGCPRRAQQPIRQSTPCAATSFCPRRQRMQNAAGVFSPGSRVRVGEAFLKRKPTEPSGVPRGESPLAPLCLLSRRRERRWPAGQTHFCRACWSLSAHINRCPNEKGYPMRGHPLLHRAAKVGKNAPGGSPGPQIAGRFSFYENRRQREHLNQRL